MAPKRKAAAQGGPASKRAAPRVSTPASVAEDSDGEYQQSESEDDEVVVDADAKKAVKNLVNKFSVASYSQKQKPKGQADAASRFFTSDNSYLTLKPDHPDRPLWIDPRKGKIIMESFSPSFKVAERFLINIAEPLSRVSKIHEYTLTPHSLFAAVSVGLTTNDILRGLDLLSKTPVPEAIREFIINSTKSFGKVRLVLKNTKYYLESFDPSVLQRLLKDAVIGPLRIDEASELINESAPKMGDLAIPGTKMAAGQHQVSQQQTEENKGAGGEDVDLQRDSDRIAAALLEEDDDEERDQVHSFEIAAESVQEASKRCRAIDLPLTEEYDFRNDHQNANLDIDLKPAAQIRPYQEQALSKMFGNGRARSGIIVLPCGAGKTLVGITAACTVRKAIIVLCTSAMSVVQWRAEFLKWSNVNPNDVAVFTADHKDRFPGNTGIIISTYSMVTQSKTRSHDSQKVMDFIEQREWGLMVLDEVHVVPAEMFKKATYRIKAHSKLGLTATLLREDDKIQDLNFLIGPKLYEANWQELSEQGHIARVQCAEVWCPMTAGFYHEYIQAETGARRALLFTMNPRKFQACQYLINYHEQRGDKIIVFSDNVHALQAYARRLGKAYIFGDTPQNERLSILENFQHNPAVNTVFLSKIGDTSLDLPEATCLIQISSHYGSRRQEAQRLGRILRAKRRNDEGFNAFFYSLVSKDTDEMYYSSKRQAFLVDQGYAFKVITHLQGMENTADLAFSTNAEQMELLRGVLIESEKAAASEHIEGDLFSDLKDNNGRRKKNAKKSAAARRTAGSLLELSGGQGMAYAEYNKSRNRDLKKGTHSAFMRKMQREEERKRKARAAAS